MTTRSIGEPLARAAVIGTLALGCATASRDTGPNSSATAMQTPPPSLAVDGSLAPLARRTSDVLTSTEISRVSGLGTAYDLVERLRPWFLHQRSSRSGAAPAHTVRPAVFVDGFFQGEIEILRTIPAASVLEVQYIRPLDAVHRYGPDYQAGIILVRAKR